jgi:hypothetical protein
VTSAAPTARAGEGAHPLAGVPREAGPADTVPSTVAADVGEDDAAPQASRSVVAVLIIIGVMAAAVLLLLWIAEGS